VQAYRSQRVSNFQSSCSTETKNCAAAVRTKDNSDSGRRICLLDALKSQLVTLHQDADGVRHELGGHLKHLLRHSSGNEAHLRVGGQVAIDIVNLVLEALIQQLVRL